ncbi:MAG TPA: DNA lyase [Solirubrobacteraceae bacterium]|nr:DNA lyase [Solirubrobacteraceae bacterium]
MSATKARTSSGGWRKPTPRRVRAIRDRLRLVYGIPQAKPHGHPIAELILTVLSQSTNDRNRDVAYLGLRERFPDWEAIRDAPVDQIEEAIRPGGISKVKSARIRSILRGISDTAQPDDSRAAHSSEAGCRAGGKREGELSLDWLPECGVPDAQGYLTSLPGVGRKTAACVLLFALGMRDVPVDTHVSRVGTRLGLFRPKAAFEQLHDTMLEITPPGEELELHLNLLRHGRRTCYARRPNCWECALQRMCPSAAEFMAAGRVSQDRTSTTH